MKIFNKTNKTLSDLRRCMALAMCGDGPCGILYEVLGQSVGDLWIGSP